MKFKLTDISSASNNEVVSGAQCWSTPVKALEFRGYPEEVAGVQTVYNKCTPSLPNNFLLLLCVCECVVPMLVNMHFNKLLNTSHFFFLVVVFIWSINSGEFGE